ncbi:carboxypeptidase B-like [Haliotis rubra]|uniref:carboxypeptidase B-like n=1 Tax=Haliotis rubra TaxID=36100 RepID=UPI001EE586EE|nr:carboxypeptidase B-like [Haliotis rubra]
MLRLILLVCCVGTLFAEKVRYDGHKVIRVTPDNEAEFHQLEQFQQYLEKKRVDIWHRSSGPGSHLDFRLGPDMSYILDSLRLKPHVLIPNVQDYINYEQKLNTISKHTVGAGFDYGVYHDLDEIMDWMKDIVSQYSDIAQTFPITQSFEGRQLNGIKISVDSRPGKQGIWLEGGIHAREWISTATVIYMTGQLLEQNGKNPDVTAALKAFDIYIVPVVNVDGYEYTRTTDRMWRKTRSKRDGQKCVGVDPNRNWDFHWCEVPGASTDPCSDSYCGPSAFSEKVVGGIANYIQNETVNIVGFIDFHSFSQLWMTPWAYTTDLPKDAEAQKVTSAAAVDAIEAVHGTKYKYGSIANIIYVASGSSVDWTYGVADIKYSVGVELRDTGKYGYLLPPDQIVPSGEETLAGVLAYMSSINMS